MTDFINTSSLLSMEKSGLALGTISSARDLCVYYMLPLFVMVITSLKSLEEIRTGR